MSKRTIVLILFILTLTSSIIIFSPNSLAVVSGPTRLELYVGPSTLPADSNVYECIFVQLQDFSFRPARAIQDTTVSLSSSLTSVGDVDPVIIISEGSTFAVANFYSTFTPGTTTITATASDYGTVQANLVTAAPVPSKIALYGFPPVLPADGGQYDALVVQLQDSNGNPAKAPLQGITVTLTSSNSTIASVPGSVTISGGQTYTLSSVTSNAIGSATITAMTSGYSSATAVIASQQPSTTQPRDLKIYVAPPKTLADNTVQSQIVIELLNATGAITRQPETPITIQLTSSNENVGTVQPTLEIPAGQVYATATFSTTYKAGVATITAAATNLTTDTKTITTIGPVPTKLVVYCNPSALPADPQTYYAIQVQLQDAAGKPALDPDGDVTVSLFSSDLMIGTVPTTLTIPYGKSYSVATFTPPYLAGSPQAAASASGYTTILGRMQTYMIDQAPLFITVTSDPKIIASGKQANVTAYVVDPGGNPTSDATVRFTQSNGTLSATRSLGNGYYSSIFTAPKLDSGITNITITAAVSKTDYTGSTATTQIIIATFGTIQIIVKNLAGQPLGNATVYTLSQPSGMTALTGKTDSLGNVTFPDVPEGNYTFSVNKQGYLLMNTTFNFKAGSPPKTVFLTGIGDQSTADSTFAWLILGVIMAAVIVAIVVLLVVMKHRNKNHLPENAPFNVNF